MTFSTSRSRIAAWTPLAVVSALSCVGTTSPFAQTTDGKALPPVVVTASRFADTSSASAVATSVISAEEIREAGIGNVNEAVRKIGGVYGRQSFNGSSDFSLDLRGFGEFSGQNLVILVDGIRISESAQGATLLSSIPIETVERIEIVRGGSSVLYGEGATGGTIQVITKRGARAGQAGSVVAEAGSFGHREARVSVSKAMEGLTLDASGSAQQADNYRDHNESRQRNFSTGVQWASNEGRVGLRADVARQRSEFAGALTMAQYQANPRQVSPATPSDSGAIDLERYTLFGERRLGNLEFAAELAHSEKTSRSSFSGSNLVYDGHTTQLSPRIRHQTTNGSLRNELVVGIDLARTERRTDSSFSRADAEQKSKALYARDEIRVDNARIAFGARHEKFDKSVTDPAPFTANYSKSHSLNAWELQGSYAFTPVLNVFAKTGKSYRVANVDDNAWTPVPSQPLEPQTSRDLELGVSAGKGSDKATVRVFEHRLTNEIAYNPLMFANMNLDPTRRRGVELELSARVASAFVASANLQHVSAEFRSGPNAGKEVALVPKNTATLRLNWLPGTGQSAFAGLQWVDSQRYGGDFANNCTARIPSFATLDARYAKRFGAWELAVSGTNLTDKDYFSNAYTNSTCSVAIYPDAGRQLKVSARMEF